MDFLLFQVLFGVLVIALAVSGWMLLRSLRERREAKTQGWTPPPREPRTPRLRRKAPPEPIADPEPARVRKRQIVPLAALEAGADDEAMAPDGHGLSDNDAGQDGSVDGNDPEIAFPQAESPAASGDDPAAALTPSAPTAAPVPALVHGETMELLEDAFVRLQREEITLADYCDRIAAQERALADRLAVLSASAGANAAIDDTLAAQDAVRWCRQWADDLVREADGDPPTP